MNTKTSLLSLAAFSCAAVSLSAQTIYSFNYDTTNPGGNTAGFGFASANFAVTADGVGGSNGGTATFDSTGSSGGMAFGQSISTGRNGSIATGTTASEYVLSFDAKALGLLAGQSMNGQVEVGFNFAPKVTASGANALTITSDFQTFTLNLGSDFNTVPTVSLSNLNNNIQFQVIDFSAHTHFGYDSGNAIVFDNISLTQVAVPEPSTYAALAGLVALGAVVARRRRS